MSEYCGAEVHSKRQPNLRSAALLSLLGFFPLFLWAGAAFADVTGTVFRDYDSDGVQDALEPGVPGATVTTYGSSGALGTGTTVGDGTYSVTGGAPSEAVRVEITLPASLDFLRPGVSGADSATTLTFVTMPADGSDAAGIDVALANPSDYCQAVPDLVTSCYVDGDQSGSLDTLVSFAYTASGQNPTPPVGDEATESDIGTTFGLAYQRSSDTLFAASYMKRHSGFGDSSADGTGVIYQIDDPDDGVVGAISQFLNLNTLFGSQVAGANPHPAGSDFTLDAASFPLVGKLSLGDMDISEDELTLWVVNLADRQLYEIPLGTDPANPVAPVSSTEVDTFPLYDLLDCDDDGAVDLVSDIDLRPFAVEVQDGLIYLGLTCTAESTQATADLSAAVFTFDPDTDTFANVLQFDLDYARGCILSDFGTCLAAANSANWNPWQSSWPVTGVINLGGTVTEYAFPQPLLTDLDFAEDGTLLLGMRDRFGDQMGYLVPPPDNSGNSRADAAGDILRATPNGLGGFNFSTVEATNGTEFFFDDDWTDTRYSHAETAFGGVVALPGTGEIVTTLMDPVDGAAPLDNDFSAGMRWMSLATGVVNQAYEVYDSQAAFFGKANGLGDLEAICEPAPLEIGNRVWCDEGDGVQDPGEAGIAGLTVTLVCDTDGNGTLGGGSDLNVTTVTDGSGQYLFNNGNVVGGIPVRTTCQVRVSRVAVNGSCGDVAEATVINASSGTNSDIRDSDGGDVTGTAVVSGDTVGVEFTTGAAGDVNHTFDLGFRPSLGAPNPGALDIEKISIPSGPVVAGQTYAYSILVTNNSGITHTGIELFANPPAGLSYVAESTSATGPRTVITNLQVRDNFGTVAFDNQDGSDNWSSDWIEDDAETLGAAAGNVQITGGQLRFDDQPNTGTEPSAAREVDLSGLSTATFTFDFATSAGVDPTDAVTVEVSSNGGASYTTLEVITGLDDVNTGSRSFDISGSIAANTRIRFRVTNLYGGGNEFFFVDNVQIIASGSATSVDTLDNDPVSAAPALVDGAPLNLIEPADFFTLAPGESMTVTFQVTVDSPIAAGVTEFLCPATVNSNEGPPASDFAVNPVADGPGIIGDFVWFDIDGDGVQDPGEPGIPGAQVNLHAANNCDGPVLETTTTDANGLYVFSSLPAGDYCVEVYEATLPDGYFSTTGNNPTVLTLPSGATDDTVDFGYEAVACLPDIGFEVDALGQTIYPGQVIDSEFSAWGVGISAVAGGGGVNELMVFNSSSPTGGDDDLGTPNVEFGGPGIGGGGAAGAPFENRFDLGNIGIISANGDETNPNDNAGGGTITVTFDRDVEIDELGFVDNGDTLGVDGGEIRLFNAGAVQIGAGIAIPGVGDNGVSVVSSIGGVGVRSVEVELFGSGGLDVLRTCGLPELTGALGDRVWLDTDGDGLQDVGEPGIPNVEVTLFDVGPNGTVGGGDDIAVATTTTDTNGLYLFDGLPPGTFYVDVTDATVPTGLALSPGNADPGAAVVLAEGALDLDSDFGYSNASAVTGVIGDTVWSDPDADGLLDPGEPGIAGVTVDLVSAGTDGIFGTVDDVVEDTATTGADGRYLFVGVAAGKYRVDVTDTGNVLTGYTLTAGPQSNPDPSYAINLAAGETYLLADFGYDNNALFSIDDTAWVDIDRDGVLDPGESGIPGVTVSLLDGSGNAIASTVTDANGDFSFDGLPNGSYTLRITDTDFVLNGFETTTSPAAAGQQAVTIAGADVSGTNFGYVRPGVVGDTVWSDADGDGVQDPDEAGIPGVTVQIFYDLNGNGALDVASDTVVETAVTDAFGRYVFERLFPGTYVVSIDDTQPALTGFTHTTADSQAAAGDQLDATLSSADLADLDNDFGYRNTALADISGTVFHDIDRDGFDDGVGEPGLEGVTVELRDASGNPIAKALTDANGDYSFEDLPDGDYTVAVTDERGVLDDYTLTSGLDRRDVTLAGVDVTDIDFGYARENELGRIGDYVWLDANRDGIQDAGESGIPNVTLRLFDAGPDRAIGGGDDVLVATTSTDANGGYAFPGLDDGDYYVDLDGTTLPSGLVATVGTTDPSSLINLGLGEVFLLADFGYGGTSGSSALGDRVWVDVDGDGVQDAGEAGIEGVTVTAVGPSGTFTTTTGPGGFYLFTGLAEGDYTVTVDSSTLPAGLDTAPTNGPASREFAVPANADVLTADFGFDGPALGSIGDFVWLDTDGDGVQDAGELGIEGVTLDLLDASGDVVATMTTDEDGAYDFTGLLAGNYQVRVTDLGGVLDGLNLSGGTNPTGTIALAAGQDFDLADFGYTAAALNGSLGNLVWRDVNGDGDVDSGEPGIGGVTVDLWFDVNGNGVLDLGTDNYLRTTTTDANGEYLFKGLLPTDYLVDVTDTAGVLTGLVKTTGIANVDNNSQADPYAVTLTGANPSNLTADFGYEAAVPFNLSGTAFVDTNEDGTQNGGESGVSGVTVDLFLDLDGDGVLDPGEPRIGTTTTDGVGDYSFAGLPNGDYIVAVDTVGSAVGGFDQTTQTATGGVQPATIAGADSTDNDFGFVDDSPAVLNPAAIGDYVWLDVDGDGVQDIGEPGIPNVDLQLFDVGLDGAVGGGDDVLLDTVTTDAFGAYLFPGLDAGTYYVDVVDPTVPAGLTLSPGGADPTSAITVALGDVFLDADFGYQNDTADAVIGNYVWHDVDGDGVQDPGEPGIGGVTVDLVSAGLDGILGTGDDVVEGTATTTDDGWYLFTGVTPGDYVVDVTNTGAVLSGFSLTSGPQSQPDPSNPITVAAGDVFVDADFGYQNGTLFEIADRLWRDIDGDGVQDPGEPGIGGVTISLLDDDGDVIATTTTDANGDFSFDGLRNGDYTLSVTDNTSVLRQFVGTTPPATADALDVTIAGADVSGINFGYNVPGTFGDRVWSDADGDDVQDPGEPGIAGVTVQLWRDADGNGIFDDTVDTLIGSDVTDGAGNYLFEGLAQGTYFASVDGTQAALAAYTATTPDQEVGPNAAGQQIEGELANSAGSFLTADFGFQNSALPDLSGNVFEDQDRDGVDDGVVDPGIPGVTLDLVDASGTVVATTTTDADGDYAFLDLEAGDYTVVVTDTAGVLADYFLTSGLDAIDVTVIATDITDIDFGYAQDSGTGSIGDFVWLDANSDGIQGGAEDGIAGVTVRLFDAGPDGAVGGGDDVLVDTTVTGATGLYLFDGLDAGNYYAQVDTATLPAGGVGLAATTPNPSTLINLSEGEFYPDADFGFGSSPGVGAIGDFVWFDADADGIQDSGEVGIAGVEIQITGPGCSPCTTTTDADGSYLFTGLTPGNFSVVFNPATVPAAYTPVATNNDGDWDIEPLSAGQLVATADFGFPAAGTVGSIGDTVFLDADGDGVQDPGEGGIEGVTLNLLDSTGTNILATAVTDENGVYDFVGLPAGTYLVAVTDTGGVLGDLNLSAGTNPTAPIVLAAGQDYDLADFPYTPSSGAGTIGNLVWHDISNDGDVDPGEPGLQGVTVDLWVDVNGNGTIDAGVDNFLRTAVTDSNGEYEFNSLPAGTYLVDVTDTAGVLAGFTKTTGLVGVDSNSQADPYSVTLSTGAPNNLTADFGYYAAADLNISGTTFFDLDGDGSIDAVDDFGVDEVTVFLFRDLDGDGVLDPTDALIDSQPSTSGGTYLFTNLPPGDYIVAVNGTGTFVDGAIQTTQLLTSNVEPVTLLAVDSTDNDFGFNRPATWVLVTGLRSYGLGGHVVVEWETGAEIGSAGFYLYRLEADGSAVPVHDDLVPSVLGAPQGGVYRVLDRSAAGGETYVLAEVQRQGGERLYGPYAVGLEPAPTEARGLDARILASGWDAVPRPPSVADLSRLTAHRAAVQESEGRRAAGAEGRVLDARGFGQRAKILVDEDGLQYLSASRVAGALGVGLGKAQNLLQTGGLSLVRHDGRPVAWFTEGGDGLYFYGEGIDSLFTTRRVYWLEEGRGETMPTVSTGGGIGRALTFVEEAHIEEDVFAATFTARDPERDYWHWKGLIAGHPTVGTASFDLDLPGLDSSSGDIAFVTVHLQGASESDVPREHRAVLSVGSEILGATVFDGLDAHTARFGVKTSTLEAALLSTGKITVDVAAEVGSGSAQSLFYVDGFDVEYPRRYEAVGDVLEGDWNGHPRITVDGFGSAKVRVFDLLNPLRPKRIVDPTIEEAAPGRFLVGFRPSSGEGRFLAVGSGSVIEPEVVIDQPSDLLSRNQGADYLVITSGELMDAALRLADHRGASSGLSTQVVDIEDIMDEWSGGLYHPETVREFLGYATSSWRTSPRYVVLVGAGHFDYRDLQGFGGNPVPPLLVGTPFGLYASDSAFGDFDFDGSPEVLVSRIPALTAGEVVDYIAKLRAYESAGVPGFDAILVADNVDAGGDFTAQSEQILAFMPRLSKVERIYLDEQGLSGARARLLAAIDTGAPLVTYAGHGGVDRWAEEGLLQVGDVGGLTNLDSLGVFSSFSCNVARFELPGFTALAEALVLHPDGGSIAALAPSGLALGFESHDLNRLWVERFYGFQGGNLGDITLEVLRRFQGDAQYPYSAAVYNLIGDPLVLPRPLAE